MTRRGTIAVCLALIVVIGSDEACAASESAMPPAGKISVVVLPPLAAVYKAGFLSGTPAAEWTATASTNLATAMRDAIDQSMHFHGIELPNVTPEERAAIDDVTGIAELLSAYGGGRSTSWLARSPSAATDRTLGPSLAFLRDRTGADYAIGTMACQVEQKKVVATVGAAMTAASAFAILPWPLLPPVTTSYIASFVVDLRNGELVWLNRYSGYEVAGLDYWDLREADSTQEVVRKVLEPYPDSSLLRHMSKSTTPAWNGLSRGSMSALTGEFSFNPPADWKVKQSIDEVTASHNGALLNQLHVALRSHVDAFPKTKQKSSRKSTPEQLSAQYVAELQAQNMEDLHVSETSTGAQLAGLPAFRIRYSYRLPLGASKVRMEQVVIGTAVPHGLLLAELTAPQLHYFAQALPAFEASAGTVALAPYHN